MRAKLPIKAITTAMPTPLKSLLPVLGLAGTIELDVLGAVVVEVSLVVDSVVEVSDSVDVEDWVLITVVGTGEPVGPSAPEDPTGIMAVPLAEIGIGMNGVAPEGKVWPVGWAGVGRTEEGDAPGVIVAREEVSGSLLAEGWEYADLHRLAHCRLQWWTECQER